MKIIKGLVYTDKQYIELLEKRLNKAIEYIKKETYYNDIEGCCYEIDYYKCEELLRILKGEENEKK